MKTAHKIAIARSMHRVVKFGRAMLGQGDQAIFVRNNISYELDLSQGIDFAIFLNRYERQTQLRLHDLVTPGALVLDVGANVGAHTLTIALDVGQNGRVIAFEPTDFAVQKLRRNLKLNPSLDGRVAVHHCYLAESDQAKVPDAIYSAWPLEPEDGLHAKHLGREMKTETATARSLDSVLEDEADRPVQLVKIDVDGHECSVLAGATEMLRRDQPIFVMEMAPYVLKERGTSLEEFVSYFLPHGYKFFDEKTMKPLPSSSRDLERVIGDGASANVVAKV